MHRRAALATIGSVSAGMVAGCLAAPRRFSNQSTTTPTPADNAPAGTWPQIGYDAQNTRHTPDARGPRDGATIDWTSIGDRPVYPPVVDDDIYLTEAWTAGTAFALASTDGSEQWANADLPPIRWAPALHENRLFVITRTNENVVRLHALDTATGDQEWVREEGITASSGEQPPIGPTVYDGTVYLSSNRGVIACETTSGAIEWTATLGKHVVDTDDGPAWRTDWATPAVTADRVFTFDTNDSYKQTREVYAVDRATGDRAWTAELELADGWSLQAHAVAGSDHVFVSALDAHVSLLTGDSEWSGTERLFALDQATGDVVWDWELSGKTLSPPAYADGTLYVGEWYPDADTGRLHAVDATDGSISWSYRTEAGGIRSPTVAGDTVYIVQGKQLAGVAIDDGTKRWRLKIGARPGSLVVVGDMVYLQTNPGHDYDSHLLAIRES